ncbi:MAG TPA: hypothetical protein VH325_09645 [Bryobacteraceae bacterium]|nr:hypothetical protein [Bryobacteraceae bacterium]
MDLKKYFRKLREIEACISESYPVVISLETADGGKAGVATEVPRAVAARMVVEGQAVLATEEQIEVFKNQHLAAKQAADKAELAKRVQVAIISDPELERQFSNRKSNGPTNSGK